MDEIKESGVEGKPSMTSTQVRKLTVQAYMCTQLLHGYGHPSCTYVRTYVPYLNILYCIYIILYVYTVCVYCGMCTIGHVQYAVYKQTCSELATTFDI